MTEIKTRHSLIVKHKTFKQNPSLRTNNGGKMTGAAHADDSIIVRDESDDEDITISDIPAADDESDVDATTQVIDDTLNPEGDDDDKKKLGFKTTYDGFSIWGWVLCLFVERKGGPGQKSSAATEGNAQALMQDWITSTQQQREDDG